MKNAFRFIFALTAAVFAGMILIFALAYWLTHANLLLSFDELPGAGIGIMFIGSLFFTAPGIVATVLIDILFKTFPVALLRNLCCAVLGMIGMWIICLMLGRDMLHPAFEAVSLITTFIFSSFFSFTSLSTEQDAAANP